MTKTFNTDSIIPVEDYFVVVDKEAKISVNDWFTFQSYPREEYQLHQSVQIDREKGFGRERFLSHEGWSSKYVRKAIATIGKRIGDIPLIELSKVDGLSILKSIGYDNDSITPTEKWIAEEVYKANKGEYSEEDMRTIASTFMMDGSWIMSQNPGQDRDKAFEKIFNKTIKSLQTKRPVKIVLSLENDVPLSENGIIKPISVEYE